MLLFVAGFVAASLFWPLGIYILAWAFAQTQEWR